MAEVLDAKLDNLDALAARIDRAVVALTRLKDENARLAARVHELEARLGDGEKALGGRTVTDLLGELDGLKAAEKLWLTERKEIAHRIEELVGKLEKIGE